MGLLLDKRSEGASQGRSVSQSPISAIEALGARFAFISRRYYGPHRARTHVNHDSTVGVHTARQAFSAAERFLATGQVDAEGHLSPAAPFRLHLPPGRRLDDVL